MSVALRPTSTAADIDVHPEPEAEVRNVKTHTTFTLLIENIMKRGAMFKIKQQSSLIPAIDVHTY